MNKKLLSLFIGVGVLALASCDIMHVHTFDMELFEKNETSHWHKATCNHTDLVKKLEDHVFGDDNICDVCGYTKQTSSTTHEHTFANTWSRDNTSHWHAATCGHVTLTSGLAAHVYGDDNVCDDCGFEKPAPVIPHEHTFATGWTHDETNHWHQATCEHEDLTKGLEAHNFGDDNVCVDCGYIKPAPAHVHTYDLEHWETTSTHHWHTSTCEHTGLASNVGEHSFDKNGECTVCGYKKEVEHYSFLLRSDYCELDNENIYEEGEEVELSLTIKDEFKASSTLPENIEVYSKGVLLTKGTDYTYEIEGETGKLSLTVKGDIVVIAFKDKNQDSFKINEAQFADAMNVSDESHLQYNLTAGFYSSFSIIMQQYGVEYSPNVTYRGSYSFDASRNGGSINCDYTYIEKENETYTEYHSDKSGVWTTRATDEGTFNGMKSVSLGWFPFISGFQLTYDRIKDNFNSATNAYEVYFTYQEYDVKFEVTFYNGKLIDISYEGTYEADRGIFGNITVSYLEKDVSIPNEAKPNYYSVIWKNYDGSILEIAYKVKEGTIPTCGTTPIKDDGGHVFNFTGWSPEVGPITENMVFTANFEQDMSQKLVIFKDDLGNELNRQLVLVGDEPDMTKFTYKGIIENNKVKVLTGWDKPLGKIYEDTTFVGSYETYNKTLTAGEINEVLSTASLGTNSAFDIYTYKNSSVSNIQHVSIANKKYKSVFEYIDSENIDEVYMDENYRYHYRVHDGVERAMINPYEETPLFDYDIQYNMSSFVTDADYTFDLETGLFISNGSRRKVFLEMRDGQINYIKSILDYDMDAEGNATTYEELHNLKIGGVEPFDIPEHDYEGAEKYKVTFVDLSLQVINEQFVYEGALPDFSKAKVPERIDTEDRILEFKGWENIVEPVHEDVTFTAQYYVYKKTYTKDEIKAMLTAEAYGNNISFEYSYGTETAISWTKHMALSNGVYKEYTDPDENYSYYERYADSNYSYYLLVEYGQEETCTKKTTSNSPESRVDDYFKTFVNDADYVYDEDLDLYVSENSYKTIWLKLKDGKVCFLKYELKQVLGSYGTLEITGVGDVPSITIPSFDWQSDSK